MLIRAPLEAIFSLAAEIERWPERLPHYRRVRPLAREGTRLLAHMAAWRDWIPVAWTAVQEVRPELPAIFYRHVGGLTTGMYVEWRFEPVGDGGCTYRVAIAHRLDVPWPWAGPLVARYIIGDYFVRHIAGRTLHCIKQLAEQEAGR